MDNQFYMGFLTIVQVAVAFCLGMIYIDKSAILIRFLNDIFNSLRNWNVANAILNSIGRVTQRIRDARVSKEVRKYRERLNARKDKYRAALDSERASSYLSSIGTISGLFSILWLIYIPYCPEMSVDEFGLFLTIAFGTILTEVCILFWYHNKKKPFGSVAGVVVGVLFWILILFAILYLRSRNVLIQSYLDDKNSYVLSIAVCFAPVWLSLIVMLYYIFYRFYLLVIILTKGFIIRLWQKGNKIAVWWINAVNARYYKWIKRAAVICVIAWVIYKYRIIEWL